MAARSRVADGGGYHRLHRVAAAWACLGLLTLATMLVLAPPATSAESEHGMKIQEVRSPGGIVAWLVEEHSVPLVALRFSFAGGSAQDPEDKAGVASFLTSMLDEGAGDLKSQAFHESMEELGMRMSFSEGRDAFFGSVQMLSQYRSESIALLKLALTKPRFDEDALERMRKQILSNLAFSAKSPNHVAQREWGHKAFPAHPYGRPQSGTEDTVRAITAADLRDYQRRIFARSGLKIAVVGDIDAKTLATVLDDVFGHLPAEAELFPVAPISIRSAGQTNVVEMPVPQSVVIMGADGILRDDPDFIPAYVMNHILGGGGFAARLMNEVREKRGLAYSVSSHLIANDHAAALTAFVATKNEKVADSIAIIRQEMRRMAEQGITEEELANAKSYLTGSYALRFDTNSKIASQLLGIQQENLGIDYVNRRNDLINAVTRADIKRMAERLLQPDKLAITVVGQPQNLVNN